MLLRRQAWQRSGSRPGTTPLKRLDRCAPPRTQAPAGPRGGRVPPGSICPWPHKKAEEFGDAGVGRAGPSLSLVRRAARPCAAPVAMRTATPLVLWYLNFRCPATIRSGSDRGGFYISQLPGAPEWLTALAGARINAHAGARRRLHEWWLRAGLPWSAFAPVGRGRNRQDPGTAA